MRTLIVDDEPLARSRLKRLLNESHEAEVIGEASNASEALALVEKLQPDLVMLDIEMPGMDGLTLAEALNQLPIPPAIVVVTAHPEHALDAYRVGPSDYLLKPVDPSRLKATLERVGTHTRAHIEKQDAQNPWISYQVGNSVRRIRFDQVQYFVAEDKVVKMVFDGGEAIVDSSLTQLQNQYGELVLRIHRHTICNRSRVVGVIKHNNGFAVEVTNTTTTLDISKRCEPLIKKLLRQ